MTDELLQLVNTKMTYTSSGKRTRKHSIFITKKQHFRAFDQKNILL